MGGLGGGSSSSTPQMVYTPGVYSTDPNNPYSTAPAQGLMNKYLNASGVSGGPTGTMTTATPFQQQSVNATPLQMQTAFASQAPAGSAVTATRAPDRISAGFNWAPAGSAVTATGAPAGSAVTANMSNINPNISSVYGGELQKQLLNPSFNPNAVQTNMLNQALSLTNAGSAARGLGQASELEQVAAISPLLNQMQQQNISNLAGANAQDIQQQLAQNQFGLSQNQLNNQFGQAAQTANNQYGLTANQLNNQFGQSAQNANNQYGLTANQLNNQFGLAATQQNNQFGLDSNQQNNFFGQAAQNANNQYGLAANQMNNQFGQNAAQINNAATLGGANWLTGAQGLQAGLNNQMAGGNLAAQQAQQQNLMTALGLVAPGASIATNTQSSQQAKPGMGSGGAFGTGSVAQNPGQLINNVGNTISTAANDVGNFLSHPLG